MHGSRVRGTSPPNQCALAPLFETLESRRLLSAWSGITLHDDLRILKNSSSASDIQGFTPSQIKTAYGFSTITFSNGAATGDGAGQTIAIVDAFDAPYIQSDLGVFDGQFGLNAPPSFKVVNESGGSKLPATNPGWAGEISLDVEWAHAIAPAANILLVEANSASLTDLLAGVNYARHAPGVSAVSMSWGGSEFFSFNGTEFTGETQDDSFFTTPSGHGGITFVASAGDGGSGARVQWPAVSPNVVSVGGTSLYTSADGTYSTEYSWIGTSGGNSAIEPTPAYQSGVDFAGTRSSPDVAYVADPNTGVAVFDSLNDDGYVGWQVVGGTSAGAPQWAALIAIADQGRALSNLSALNGASQTLPILYSLYGAPGTSGYAGYTSNFNDVIDPGDFYDAAPPGYDQLTGLGSPKAVMIVDALAGITPGSQPITPITPPPPVLPASPIEASIVSQLPNNAVGATVGSMTLRLFNTGATPFDGPLSVGLFATTDGSFSTAASPFATIPLNHVAVNPNRATDVLVHFRYPTSVPNGSYQFAAAVTATGTDTAAADALSPNRVTIAAPIVDLSATAARFGVAVSPGRRTSIELRIRNTGNFIALGVLTVHLYSSTDSTLDPSDPLLFMTAERISLRPRHARLIRIRFPSPASLTPGSYELIAAASSSTRPPDVDSGDKVAVIATRA